MAQNRAYTISQITDLTDKLQRVHGSVNQRAPIAALAPELAEIKTQASAASSSAKGKEAASVATTSVPAVDTESALAKVVKDSGKITAECQHGLM